mgnify:CR=1 FL=1
MSSQHHWNWEAASGSGDARGTHSDKGSGEVDATGRSGPWVAQAVLSTIPDGMTYEASTSGKYAQLKPKPDPQKPSMSELFQEANPSQVVFYPRYLDEPQFDCGKGHKIFLSRIPWQSGCRECKVPGLT